MKDWTKNRLAVLILGMLMLPGLAVVPAATVGPDATIVSVAQSEDDGDGGAETAAVAAAQEWLSLVDEGRYADSWEAAATYFRNAVTLTKWEQAMLSVRKPLGAVLSRQLKSADHETSLPGAPDGDYVVIQFTTVFENKADSVETVTPMLDADGAWHVSGYFIK